MRYLASIILTLCVLTFPSPAAVQTPQVEIYTIPGCTGCVLAKSMFEERNIPYKEISLKGSPTLYRQMKERVYAQMEPNDRRSLDDSMTVPRIFINGKYIGGYGDLDGSTLDNIANQLKANPTSNSTSTARETNKNQES